VAGRICKNSLEILEIKTKGKYIFVIKKLLDEVLEKGY
jgi:hypothetical protein